MNWVINFLFWSYRPVMGFITLTGLFIFLFLKKKFPKVKTLKKIIIAIGLALILFALSFSFLNAYFWKHNFLGEKLLPPYTSPKYIFRYSFVYYWWKDVITFIISGIIFWLMKLLNKKFHSKFFYEEEPYLAVIGILLTSWPNCLIFLILVLFLGIISHFLVILTSAHNQYSRFPLLYFWLPSALLVLIFSAIINQWPVLQELAF